jgi:hypothetical protein
MQQYMFDISNLLKRCPPERDQFVSNVKGQGKVLLQSQRIQFCGLFQGYPWPCLPMATKVHERQFVCLCADSTPTFKS